MIEPGMTMPRAVPTVMETKEYNQMLLDAGEAAAQPLPEGYEQRVEEARSRAEMLENPQSVNEAYLTSWKSLLARNLGRRVVVSFLVGTQNTVVARGILYEIGSDYIVLYQPDQDSYITADLYSVKFVEFRVIEQTQ